MQISDLVYIDETGYHYADYPTFLEYEKQKYRGIYGADVYLEDDSQDGQLIAIRAQGNFDMAAVGASTYNSFSPSTAQGVGLARNVKINGIVKRVATNSTVDLDIGGTAGTTITSGVATDNLNQKWNLPLTVIIPLSGTITVTATAAVAGAIAGAATTITKIFTPTQGWQTVNNPTAATLGVPIESDAELRGRQTVSTANPSKTVFEGTNGAVKNVSGVTAERGYENDTNITDGDGIPAHMISIVVAGGDDTDIAQAIMEHKGPGCGTYGTTSIEVFDEEGMPSIINFYRPTQVTIKVEVTIDPLAGYLTGYEELIKSSVADYINSLGIGNDVLITKLYIPANLAGRFEGDTFDILTLKIAKNADPLGTANLDLAFNELAVCNAATDVTVVI